MSFIEKNVEKIKHYLDMNIYANAVYRLSSIDVFVVRLTDDSVKIFKTIRGNFVYDLLDYSYLNGLEVSSLEEKMILSVLKTDLKNGYMDVSFEDLKKVFRNKIKPKYLVYLVYDSDLGNPYTLKVNMSEYEGLYYVELKDIIFYTYKKFNKNASYDRLKICLVDYIT